MQVNSSNLRVTHRLKDKTLQVPLSIRSSHAPSVHFSWPLGFTKRVSLLNSDLDGTIGALSSLLQRLRQNMASDYAVQVVQDALANPMGKPVSSKRIKKQWLVLPYHPFLCITLKKAISKYVIDHGHRYSQAFKVSPSIGIAWANSAPHLIKKLEKLRHEA